MRFFTFGKAHTGPLYEFLPSADIGQEVYCFHCCERGCTSTIYTLSDCEADSTSVPRPL
jgi:hypothetical protein